jgi:ATP-dependent helicase/nuclease subunit A
VLDFKTDSDMQPHNHQLQFWIYSNAMGKPTAYLAYLRHNHLHPFDGESLTSLNGRASMLVEKIIVGEFAPTANPTSCGMCSYGEICDSRASSLSSLF